MMSHSQIAYLFLWCAHPALQSAVAWTLWRRRLHRQFPAFFAYILAQIAIFAGTFPLWLSVYVNQQDDYYTWFFWSYWLGAAISAILGFKVIHEIFLDVFRPYPTLRDLGTVVFKWAGVVMLMVSVVVAFSNSEYSPLVHAVTTLQRTVRFVQFGLILFLLLFSRFLGVSRRQQSFGLALGFGLFAGVELMILALAAGGFLHHEAVNLVNTATYNLAIVIWFGYLLAPKTTQENVGSHFQTQRWEQGLADLHAADVPHPLPSDSLIPMFEGMVERALSRNSGAVEVGEPDHERSRAGDAGESPRSLPAAAGVGSTRRS
jgi:hypothetical protein